MANDNYEEEVKELKVKNNELAQKLQEQKMKAAQQENDKLELMKENNELRLKLYRMRSGGAAQARALEAALQSASEEALSHLVQASSAVARTMELAKTYMKNRQDLELISSQWSTLSNTPVKDKVHKVPPTMMGGRTTQPFVSLNRVPLSNNSTPASRSPNLNNNVTERVLPMPMHMLQDVYIPLRRIDTSELNNYEGTADNAEENEVDELLVEENAEMNDESQNMDEEDFEMSRRLEVLHEETEEVEEETEPTLINRSENPLEGPSWLLDNIHTPRPSPVLQKSRGSRTRVTLEADSTTEPDEAVTHTPPPRADPAPPRDEPAPPRAASPPPDTHEPPSPPQMEDISPRLECRVFTPTVRRRKRTSTPPPPPHAHSGTLSAARGGGRVLKVIVPKMSVESADECSRAKRRTSDDEPSYCGATDDALCVQEQRASPASLPEGEASDLSAHSSSSRGSDAGDHRRARRNRKQVTYKEKPLNRKLRR